MLDEGTQRVAHQEGGFYLQRVLVDQRAVGQPIGQRVVLLRSLEDKGVLVVEVQAAQMGERVAAIGEVHAQALWRAALCLQQEAVGLGLLEAQQGDVVGQEMGVGPRDDVLDMERVEPQGVRTGVWLPCGADAVVVEAHGLVLLAEHEVTVLVLQGKAAIGARGHTLDGEEAAAIGARHAHHGFLVEGRVDKVVIETHQQSLDGF